MVTYNKLILLILISFVSIKSSAQTVDQFLSSRFAAKNLYSLQQAANYQTVKKLIANVGFEATTVGGKKVFANRAITIGKASIANAIKNRAFSPYGLAVTAAMTAAGYILDSSSGEVTESVDVQVGGQYCLSNIYFGNPLCYSSLSEAENAWWSAYQQQWGSSYCYSLVQDSSTHWSLVLGCGANGGDAITLDTSQGTTTQQQQQPVSDTDIINAFDSYFTPEQEKEIFLNPVSRLPDVPGQSDVAADLDNDYVAQNDTDSNTNPTTGNTTINNTDITYSDNGYTDVTNVEQKDPCQLHPDSVGCLDVGKAPQDPTIETYQMPFSVNQYTLGSNAQCPAPNSITLKNGQVITFSYQTYCDFAVGIRPVVVALGLLLAFLIVGSAVREGV